MQTNAETFGHLITLEKQAASPKAQTKFLDRERTVAGPGFNRWLDDHPDSLRLVFGRRTKTYFNPSFRLLAGLLLTLVVILVGLSIARLLPIL